MPITNTAPIYERLGRTMVGYERKTRKSDVQEILASIQYQMGENRRKFQDRMVMIEKVASLGQYMASNIGQQLAVGRGAKEIGAVPGKPLSIWDWVKTAAFGYNPSRQYSMLGGGTTTAQALGWAGTESNPLLKQNIWQALGMTTPKDILVTPTKAGTFGMRTGA